MLVRGLPQRFVMEAAAFGGASCEISQDKRMCTPSPTRLPSPNPTPAPSASPTPAPSFGLSSAEFYIELQAEVISDADLLLLETTL